MDLSVKVAIITGASSGIGLASTKLLAQKGAQVTLVARSKKKLLSLSKKLPNSFVIEADLSKELEVRDMVKKAVDHFKRVDILINNAGVGYDSLVEEIDTKKLRYLIELDLIAPIIATQEVIPIMKRQNQGVIINISSGTALMSMSGMAAYSSVKRALVGISLTSSEELEQTNIKVSVVYPYVTLTDFEKNTLGSGGEMDYSKLPFPPDTPELVAQKILEAIETGKKEIFAHSWMKH